MSGQDLYSLCRTIEHYPGVYMAFRASYTEGEPRGGFLERRERERESRIRRLAHGKL